MKQLQSFKYFGLRQFQQANPTPIKKMRSFAYIQGWGGEGGGGGFTIERHFRSQIWWLIFWGNIQNTRHLFIANINTKDTSIWDFLQRTVCRF